MRARHSDNEVVHFSSIPSSVSSSIPSSTSSLISSSLEPKHIVNLTRMRLCLLSPLPIHSSHILRKVGRSSQSTRGSRPMTLLTLFTYLIVERVKFIVIGLIKNLLSMSLLLPIANPFPNPYTNSLIGICTSGQTQSLSLC